MDLRIIFHSGFAARHGRDVVAATPRRPGQASDPPGISLKVALNTGGRPNRDCLSRIVGNHRPRNDDGTRADCLQRDDWRSTISVFCARPVELGVFALRAPLAPPAPRAPRLRWLPLSHHLPTQLLNQRGLRGRRSPQYDRGRCSKEPYG